MTQIRIAALADLKGQIPTAHYFGRPHSIDADLELTRVLLGSPEGLTLREHRAAQALQDWAFCEKRFRTISDTAYPARDCDDPTPAPGMTPDQEQELIGLREVHRRSALEYATAIGDALLMARYQAPATDTASVQTATPAPIVTGGALTEQAMAPDPERRLDLLRTLGGNARYAHGRWKFRGIAALVASEKANDFKRCDEKTIRADLTEAAQAERDAKSAGVFNGLGQR